MLIKLLYILLREMSLSFFIIKVFFCFLAVSKTSTKKFDLSGSLIPDVYPEGDPSEYALPIFVEEPKNQYTARGSPANLVCKVAHAVKVHFVCNDEVMTSTSEEDMIDPEMSIRYTKITLEVKRSDAMDVLGKYVCKCQAASAQGEVSSQDASVNVACKLKLLYRVCHVRPCVTNFFSLRPYRNDYGN